MDTARASTFVSLQELPHLSKRFALKRFLGLTEEEIKENERLWREEQSGNLAPPPESSGSMRSVGINPGNMASEQADQDAEAPPDMAAAAAVGATPAEGEVAPAAAPAA
jgi:hypothetical protein